MAEERAEMSPGGNGGPDRVELKFTSSSTYRGGLRAGAAGHGAQPTQPLLTGSQLCVLGGPCGEAPVFLGLPEAQSGCPPPPP